MMILAASDELLVTEVFPECRRLQEARLHTDLVFVCGSDRTEVECHLVMVKDMSEFLRGIFGEYNYHYRFAVNSESKVRLYLPDFDPVIVQAFVELVYCGRTVFPPQHFHSLSSLFTVLGVNLPNSVIHVEPLDGNDASSKSRMGRKVSSAGDPTTFTTARKRNSNGYVMKSHEFRGSDVSPFRNATPSVPLESRGRISSPQNDRNSTASHETVLVSREKRSRRTYSCPKCSLSFAMPSVLRDHMSMKHFRPELESALVRVSKGAYNAECSLCGFQGGTVAVVRHVGSKHKMVDKFFEEEGHQAFDPETLMPDLSVDEKIIDAAECVTHDFDGQCPSQVWDRDDLTCFMCSNTFSTKSSLRKHLVIHFKHQVAKKYNVRALNCPLCKYVGKYRSMTVEHVAIAHGKLRDFIQNFVPYKRRSMYTGAT